MLKKPILDRPYVVDKDKVEFDIDHEIVNLLCLEDFTLTDTEFNPVSVEDTIGTLAFDLIKHPATNRHKFYVFNPNPSPGKYYVVRRYFNNVVDEYRWWLASYVFPCTPSYSELLPLLWNREFTWVIEKDSNRAADGINLRYRFAIENDLDPDEVREKLAGPCSMFEMMAGLAIRMEESLMSNTLYGDRTSQWFIEMVRSIKLVNRTEDDEFDASKAEEAIDKFLEHSYEPNGEGGLFTVKGTNRDFRNMEIWDQMNAYINSRF